MVVTPAHDPSFDDAPARGPAWWSRDRVSMLVALPGLAMAIIQLLRAVWARFVQHHPIWDDHFLVGLMWLAVAAGVALFVQCIAAIAVPTRWRPRWLAVVLLALAFVAAAYGLIVVLMAQAFGP